MGIIVRPYQTTDLQEVKDLHRRQGHKYDLPDPELAMVGVVIEDGGKVRQALFLRKTAEAYWIYDPTTEERRDTIGRMLVLNKEVPRAARKAGFTDVFAWIPPNVADNPLFDKTLLRLGWIKPQWVCYAKDITNA